MSKVACFHKLRTFLLVFFFCLVKLGRSYITISDRLYCLELACSSIGIIELHF